ncbi:MAG: hypothetical protein K0S39_2397, partial [Paenibacillus sp.]|nr:hypothetical protein [Paenibacillus sp.]
MNCDQNHNENFTKDELYKNLERVNFWVANVDTKTSFILAFVGIFLSIFFTSNMTIDALKKLITLLTKLNSDDLKTIFIIFTMIIVIIFLCFIVRTTIFLFNALAASVDPDKFADKELIKKSNIFFASIAAKDFSEFQNELNNMSKEKINNDINSQTYINSMICTVKFKYYNKGVKNLKYSLFSFILLIIAL